MARFSEKEKALAAAILAVCAIAAAAYAIFSSPQDNPAPTIEPFYNFAKSSDKAAIFFDVRGAKQEDAVRIYQCGVDILSGNLFAGKKISNYACDGSQCVATSSDSSSISNLTYNQASSSLKGVPYVLIKAGPPSTAYFERHIEITIDSSYSSSCTLNVKQ